MDLWVVAAATGVGYIAKYWQNISGEKDVSLEPLSRNSGAAHSEPLDLLQHRLDRNHPFRKLGKNQCGGDFSSDGKYQELERVDTVSAAGVASVSGSDGKVSVNMGGFEDYKVLSLANLTPREGVEGYSDGIRGENDLSAYNGDALPQFSGEMLKKSRSLRSRTSHGFSGKPLSSLESYAKLDEHVFGAPSPSIRPLLVVDESKTISRRDNNLYSMQFDDTEEKSMLLRMQPLQHHNSVELPRKPKQMSANVDLSRSGGPLPSQGSSNGMLLFFIGITMGIMSATTSNKREVDKLNNLLKQTENLVEDLHEELEMKDALTVRELASEGSQSLKRIKSSSSFDLNSLDSSFKRELGESKNYECKDPELMTKIEAELEAELERLELNMKASSSEKISDFVELDPDFEADVVQGELILKTIHMQPGGLSGSDCDGTGTSTIHHTDHSGNYAVSPRGLSLRLHEVIESRLEARIMELEEALENSQKKVHTLESQQPKVPRRDMAYSEVGSSSAPESPTFIDETQRAYEDEAYVDITPVPLVYGECPGKGMPQFANVFEDPNYGRSWEEEVASRSLGSIEVAESDDDDDDYEDELEQLLIKQIVEKTRKGSSLFLDAHLMYSSMDDDNVEQKSKY